MRAIEQAPALTHADAVGRISGARGGRDDPADVLHPGHDDLPGALRRTRYPVPRQPGRRDGVGVNKVTTRCTVAAAGVAVPAAEILGPGERPTLPYPVVVKPVDADNSVAVSLARDPDEYDAAARSALTHSCAVLVEAYVELGREVRCGIIVRDGELVCLPLEEYAVDPGTQTDSDTRGQTRPNRRTATCISSRKIAAKAWIVGDDDTLTERVWEAARRCHVALGCRHYSLFDFRIDPDGRPWFLEAGLYCSYSPGSVIAVMAVCHRHRRARTVRDRARRNETRRDAMFDVTAMTPIGARLTGLRVDTLDAGAVSNVRYLLAEYGVLVLPGSARRRCRVSAFPAKFRVDDVHCRGNPGSGT